MSQSSSENIAPTQDEAVCDATLRAIDELPEDTEADEAVQQAAQVTDIATAFNGYPYQVAQVTQVGSYSFPPGMNLDSGDPELGELTPPVSARYTSTTPLRGTPPGAPIKGRRIIFHGVGSKDDPYVFDGTESEYDDDDDYGYESDGVHEMTEAEVDACQRRHAWRYGE